jgi:hypothetical protein
VAPEAFTPGARATLQDQKAALDLSKQTPGASRPKGAEQWGRKPIEAGEPYVTVEISGSVVHGSRRPEDVGGPARVYCGGRRDYDDPAVCGHWASPNKMQHRPTANDAQP